VSPDEEEAALAAALTPHHHPWCFGCGPDNPNGLHLPWDAVEDGVYTTALRLDERHQGGPGLAHGGIVSAVLDEAMGILVQHVAFPAVTARIEVKYRKPVPTGSELALRAEVVRVAGRQITADATLHHDGLLVAEGRAVFLQVTLRHFLRTPEGRARRDALLARRAGGDGSPPGSIV
jgi:uncharacterized protein (TIGR00369 family)